MKNVYYLLSLLLTTSLLVKAQTNYVANTANAPGPGMLNTFVGPEAGNSTSQGGSNAFIGYRAGFSNQSGYNNAFLGHTAGFKNSTGNSNTFVGMSAGYGNMSGNFNTILGVEAGYSNDAYANTLVGFQAGRATTNGGYNVFLGYWAGLYNTSGSYNVFLGVQAGAGNRSGASNLYMGSFAGASNNGSYNLFIGNSSGQNTTLGNGNTAIGDGAAINNSTGSRNTAIGQYSGLNNRTGTDNVFIGYGARAGIDDPTNVTNSVALGANSIVSQSNSIVLGNGANVGIGNTAPSTKLHITTGQDNTSGLRLENLTIASPATGNQSMFLTVDGSGNVILGTSGTGGRVAAEVSLWQRNGRYLQSSQEDGVIIGQSVGKTPAGYNLFVSKGILTEKVKVAVKNTDEWSDKVFAPSYSLQPLAEVEHYIRVNQHLPGIPSAKEMVETGNDLHKTDAKLLEKIEELTLYSIEQQKRIAKLERMVEELLQNKQKDK